MKRNFFKPLLVVAAGVMLVSCDGKEPIEPEKEYTYEKRLVNYALSEGEYGKNNSLLSRFGSGEITFLDYYGTVNSGENIGDTAQDIIQYGNKLYITVTVSDKVFILTPSGEKLKEIDLSPAETDVSVSPRFAVGAEGKVFISTYGKGVMVLDTMSMEVDKYIELSQGVSEGIVYIEGNLYVANSGLKGDAWGGNGNTISVVSVAEQRETSTITTPKNPVRMALTKEGVLYLATWGVYGVEVANLQTIDYKKGVVSESLITPTKNIAITDKYIYTYHYDWDTSTALFFKLHPNGFAEALEHPSKDTIYSLYADNNSDKLYIGHTDGKVEIMDDSGIIDTYNLSDDASAKLHTCKVIPVYEMVKVEK